MEWSIFLFRSGRQDRRMFAHCGQVETSKSAAASLWSWRVRAQWNQRIRYANRGSGRGAGARILRGGAYKPRSSPYAFQGLGVEGLKLLRKAREETGLAIVTEVMSEEDVEVIAEYADIMQVGTRSMENFALLEALGDCGRPVLLKRGITATLEELCVPPKSLQWMAILT